MIQYPLNKVCKDGWNKKVTATYMYSIPLEDEAQPVLEEIVDLLEHLHNDPLHQVIPEEHVEYFFTQVFPPICQKILKSRYFKSQKILSLANRILLLCLNLTIKYVELAEQWPSFSEIIITVLNTDQYYYKTNNQFIDYRSFAHSFLKETDKEWVEELKEGDLLDVLKFSNLSGKAVWSRGRVIQLKPTRFKIQYLNDETQEVTYQDKNSYMIAPYKTKSENFEWRMSLKPGDVIDCEDHYGGWYNSTILDIFEKENNVKVAKITFKIYDDKGTREDEKGRYFGLGGYNQEIDVTSPKIQPFSTIVNDRNYFGSSGKTTLDNDDYNDDVFEDLCGEQLFALPRKKFLSEFLFKAINQFGRLGGFTLPIQRLEANPNIFFICSYVKGISGVAQMLTKSIVKTLVNRLKPIIQKHIFDQTDQFYKNFNKERSQMLFSGFKVLQKRIMSMEAVYEYENEKKMKLVDRAIQSEALKRKLQGLNELKDIVKSVVYGSQRTKAIKEWIIRQKLFEKIYIVNSHVQLIKKSQDFFRYLINESILEVTDLERLYKIAQKGDYQSRISLYKLFQEVSHIFKKPHVDFLIDTILESDLSLILNEDIDLLNELSKFSNYFPRQKVRAFFESIILGDIQHEALYEYATKKYSEIVAKGYEMKSSRRDIIHGFMSKLTTHNITQVSKVLKGIFEGIGVGQYGKKDLNEILAQQNIDEVVIEAIRNNKGKPNEKAIVTEVLNLLGFIYKLSYKVRILISTLRGIWNQMKNEENTKKYYYKWLNELIGLEQGIGESHQLDDFQNFVIEMFPKEQLGQISLEEFFLIKNLIIEINKKNRYLTPTHLIKEVQYRRKVEMYELKLYDYFTDLIYMSSNQDIYEKGLSFFLQIYNAKQNQIQDIYSLFDSVLNELYSFKKEGQVIQIKKALKLINILIDNSEKKHVLDLQSLVSKERADKINIVIINDIVYVNQYARKKDFTVPLNITLYQFKKILTTHYNLEIDEVKLSQEKQIPQYYNSRTLKELPVNLSDPLSLSKRYINTYYEPQMLINNKLNPKAVRCFKILFERYSTKGLMSKQQCHSFTSTCLSSITKRYDDKVNYLFTHYDYDGDGFVDIEGFLQFYEKAAQESKTATVWSNLKSFGVNSDFKFPNETSSQVQYRLFPRKKLSESAEFYETLFDLLNVNQVAPLAFQLLQRLPIYKKVYNQILGIGEISNKDQLNLQKIFQFENQHNYFYKLTLILYLKDSDEQIQKKWFKLFIQSEAIEIVYINLKNFMIQYTQESEKGSIQIEIINYQIRLLFEYLLKCFADRNKLSALSLLQTDVDLDDKIEFLVTGCFPKPEQKLQQIDVSKVFQWRGESSLEICKTFVSFFIKIWKQWGQTIQKEHSKLFTFMNALSIICFLQVDQDPTFLISQFEIIFTKPPSNKLLRQIYSLILNICFFSSDYQNLFITQLFKHITQTNITSEYFRILAVLVSKFGMDEQRVCQMPQILLNNILNQRNELTIQGCAKLLSNFHLSSQVAKKQIQLLWDNCLFGRETSCKKQQTRQAIYELILKVCQNSKQVTDTIIKKTLETINTRFRQIKITYSTEVNQRSSNGYAGLKNLGNICYMNSMLQQLFMNKTFRYLLMRIDDKKEPELTLDPKQNLVDDNFLHQIQRIFGYLQKTTRLDFIPSAFCVAYKPFGQSVNIMIQQDVQEFVSMFFDRLEEGIKNHPLKRLVDSFYHGKNANLFSCHECNQTKKVQQSFYSITLEVKNSKTLSQSFNRYILGELISQYKCDFCNKKVDVTKKTRISKAPHNLIIHLQRIQMNFETFINEKLTNKHQFPMNFNLYPYTLDYHEKEQLNEPELSKQHPKYQYQLTGIICHIGNAQMGHYISYIKNQEGKWHEYNDSLINTFNSLNIEAQCFGGSFTYDDQYDWEKRENSKSAYLLLYKNTSENLIQLELKSITQKDYVLQELNLQEDNPEPSKIVNEEQPTQSQEEGSSHVEDSEKQNKQMKNQMEQIEMIRKNKSEDQIDVEFKKELVVKDIQGNQKYLISEKQPEDENKVPEKVLIKIKDQVSPFIPSDLQKQIENDNQLHFFEKCLASPSFSKFFAKLLILPQNNSQQMIKLCQKLTFGFWLKSQSFKQLLYSLTQYIKSYPQGLQQILLENKNLVTLLIENSEIDVRANIANFLSNAFLYFIDDKKLTLDPQDLDESNQMLLKFLDNLFDLIPTTVSKCWTKFNQYFQFWYEFSKTCEAAGRYMVRKEVVKHFIDYFLDKKSPLKIYQNRPTIGSSYASPNFGMLLKTIESMIEFYLVNKIQLSKEQKIILINFNFIEKLIHDGYETIASKIVRIICPNNLYASEKIAIVLLKGLSKSNFQNVQPYLDVVHQFVLIQDEHQFLRILWIIGKQTLCVSTISKTLSAMNSYSLEDRIYEFNSAINLQSGSSLLQPLFVNNKRTQNFCIICLQELMKLCNDSECIRKYVWSLGPPNYLFGKYVDFFEEFINRYIDQSKRIYGYSSTTSFNREELGKNVKKLHGECLQKVEKEKEVRQAKENNIIEKMVSEKQQIKDNKKEQTSHHIHKQEKQNQIELQNEEEQQNREDKQIIKPIIIMGSTKVGKREGLDYLDPTIENRQNKTIQIEFPVNDDINSEPDKYSQQLNKSRSDSRNQDIIFQVNSDNQREEIYSEQSKKQLRSYHYDYLEQQKINEGSPTKKDQEEEITEQKEEQYYHPVKFNYQFLEEISSQMDHVKLQKHLSQIILVRTHPTGITNKAFTSTYSHRKVSERLDEKVWQHQIKTQVSGYFVNNNTKSTIRIQTNDGTTFIRSLEGGWVWADEILKIWIPERFNEWPEWSLYQDSMTETEVIDIRDELLY